MLRIPVPEIQRTQAPNPGGVAGLASPTGTRGVQDLARSIGDIGQQMGRQEAIAQAKADQAEKKRLDEAERIAHEQRKARVLERASKARLEWTEAFIQRQNDAPADGANFVPQTLKDFDAWQDKSLAAVQDPQERDMLAGHLLPLREHLGEKAMVFQARRQIDYRKATLLEGVDQDARTLSADPSQFAQVRAQRVAAIRNSTDLPAADRTALAQQASEMLALQAGTVLARSDPAGWLKRDPAKDPVVSAMDPASLRQLNERAKTDIEQAKARAEIEAERRARQAEAAAARRDRAAAQGWDIVSSLVRDGRTPDESAPSVQAALAAMQGTPYAKAYRELLKEAPQNAAAASQPLVVQQAQLDALMLRRNQASSPELEREIDRREKVLAAGKKGYADEPLRAAAQFGHYSEVAPLDTSSLDALMAGLPMRVEQARIAGEQTGRAESPMLADEARVLAERLAALPPAQRAERIAALSSIVPAGHAQALARQIDKQDKPLALAMAAGASMTTQGRYTSELILRGAQAIKDKSIKEEKGAEFGVRASIAKEIGDAVPAAARDDVIDAARLIYLGKQASGESISAQGAARLALGGEIVERGNGQRLPVPAGVDLEQRLAQYPVSRIAAQAPDGYVYLPGGRPMGVPEFLAALPDAQLEPVGLGRYAVRSGGSLVVNQQRRPIVIEAR